MDWGIIGRETGKSGYDHWQFAVRCAGDLEQRVRDDNLGWHVEKCISWDKAVKYCRKDGRYTLFGNPPASERLYKKYRQGLIRLTATQLDILRSVRRQNDRSVTVWIDRHGSSGKSYIGYLEEIGGRWLSVPRTEQSATRMIDYIAMKYDKQKAVLIDLPRQKVLTEGLCGVIEDLKDGNIKSAKYQGTEHFVRGLKVIVFTNNYIPPKAFKALSEDRWDIHIIKGDDNENPTR